MSQTKGLAKLLTASALPAFIIFFTCLAAGCAPETPFRGSAEVVPSKDLAPPQTDITPPSDDQTVTYDLNKQDEITLKSCQAKQPSLMQGVKVVEVQDIASSISNVQSFLDTYDGEDKRVLIINLNSGISNLISLQLGSRNTTYCLNIASQIVNKINIGISRGARLIEARQSSIMNSIKMHQI